MVLEIRGSELGFKSSFHGEFCNHSILKRGKKWVQFKPSGKKAAKGLMFSLSWTALALARRYEHTTLMHWRDQQLQTMLAVTVKMSRVRSNQCVVGVLESFLSFIFLQ